MVTADKTKKPLVQVLAALVIFISGLIIGASLVLFTLQDKVTWKGPAPDKRLAMRLVDEVCERFDLSGEQAQKIEKIFAEAVETVSGLREDYETKVQASRESTIKQMKAVLTPEQYEEWVEDFMRQAERGPGHGPGGPGHGFMDGPPDFDPDFMDGPPPHHGFGDMDFPDGPPEDMRP